MAKNTKPFLSDITDTPDILRKTTSKKTSKKTINKSSKKSKKLTDMTTDNTIDNTIDKSVSKTADTKLSSKSSSNTIKNKQPFAMPLVNRKARNIKEFCEIYKKDILGNPTPVLYKSCKVNRYCRKTKCKNIDKKFKREVINKLGSSYNVLLQSSIFSKCPNTMPEARRPRCVKTAMKRFYNENDLGNIYSKVEDCDMKTCAKERQIFYTNLFRTNKKHKRTKPQHQIKIEDMPDEQMIRIN